LGGPKDSQVLFPAPLQTEPPLVRAVPVAADDARDVEEWPAQDAQLRSQGNCMG